MLHCIYDVIVTIHLIILQEVAQVSEETDAEAVTVMGKLKDDRSKTVCDDDGEGSRRSNTLICFIIYKCSRNTSLD